MKLFWQEQQKYINSSSRTAIHYHSTIIKFCLSLAAKSSSAYKDFCYDSTTRSDLFVLPSLRTLCDYKNYIKPTKAFNPDVINDLIKKTASFSETERHVTILLDEMRIQEDLVCDEHSVELTRFVGLGDIYTNYVTLKSVEKLASRDLVLLVKRLSIHFPIVLQILLQME